MKDSIKKYLKVGIVVHMVFPGMGKGEDPNTYEHLRRVACDDYFDALELNWIKDPATRKKSAKMLNDSHIAVAYAAAPKTVALGVDPNPLDESERQKAEKVFIECIDEAEELGAKGIAFRTGKWKPEAKEQHYAQLLKTTRNLCDYAKTKNMKIEAEVFDYDIAKCSIIGPAPLAARYAADMRTTHNNFGLLVDLSHIPMTYETPEFVVRTLRPYITHFHVGNTVCQNPAAEGYGDEHQRFGFPNGANDIPEVLEYLRVLKNEGFFRVEDPYIFSFEVKPWKDEDPETVIVNAKRVLNRAWALLED